MTRNKQYIELWKCFYQDYPEYCRVAKSKLRLLKFLEVYYNHILSANQAGKEGAISTLNRLPDLDSALRYDRQFRHDNPWLFPQEVKGVWLDQKELWRKPETRMPKVEMFPNNCHQRLAEARLAMG